MLAGDTSLALDRDVRRLCGGTVLVSRPLGRVVRLTEAGARTLDELCSGEARTASARAFGQRLIDAGLAHPSPPRSAVEVTTVVPVHDRPEGLRRLLGTLHGQHGTVLVVDDASRDAAAIVAACAEHGAALERRSVCGGPAAARNTGLASLATEFVAFLDSDCRAAPDWIERLAGHFSDPRVVAVAPRVVPARDGRTTLHRYLRARSPLDLGPRPAAVVSGTRVSYVPTAALIVRRAALVDGFDETLRYGEDVDAVWRMHDAGGIIRYDPSVTVAHHEPATWRDLLRRRAMYGTSAAPLALRHPEKMAPLVVHPPTLLLLAAVLMRRPELAALAVAGEWRRLTRELARTGASRGLAATWTGTLTLRSAAHTGRALTSLAAPGLCAALRHRRLRPVAAVLLVIGPLSEWNAKRPSLDPIRWSLASIADDIAYGIGVWIGCVSHRTIVPLTPRKGARSITTL